MELEVNRMIAFDFLTNRKQYVSIECWEGFNNIFILGVQFMNNYVEGYNEGLYLLTSYVVLDCDFD